jgi:hypothetical protein
LIPVRWRFSDIVISLLAGTRIKELTMDKRERDSLSHYARWAKQTIANAMSLRADDTNKGIMSEETAKLANTEAEHLTKELWEAAQKECGDTASFNETMMTYIRKVFHWCDRHMHK